ncbi:MAG: Inner membrane transport protein YnfM [Syntrophomonadaceae bacterium]|nr:Inner membrane transport protein YnfM [Bacillota bacterium]
MLKSKSSKIAALLVSHWANDGYVVVLPPLLMVLSLEFGITTMQAAQIMSVYSIASAVGQLPISLWGDYSGRSRDLLAAGLVLLSLALLGWGWSTGYHWLLLFAFVAGLGFSGYHPISMNLMTQQFGEKKGFSLGLHTMAGSIGASMVPVIIGIFSETWRLGVTLLAIPGFLSALWIILAFGNFRNSELQGKELAQALRKTILSPMLLLVTSLSGINQMVYIGSITFLPLFFADRFGWSPAATGVLIGAFHFSALVSQPLFGYLSDLMSRNRLIYISGAGIFLCYFFIFLSRNPLLSACLGVLAGACVLAMRTLVIAKVSDIAGAETRSAAIAVSFTFSGAMGALAPLLGGYLQQAYSYEVAFLVFGFSIILGLGFLTAQGRLGKNKAGFEVRDNFVNK